MTSTCCSETGEFIKRQSPTSLLVTDKLNTIWENRWVYIILFELLLHFCFGSYRLDGDLWALFSVALVDHDTQYEEDAMNLDNFWFYRRLTDEIPDVRLACQTACVLLHCSEELYRDVSLSCCLIN